MTDLHADDLELLPLDGDWRFISDGVMGGVSRGEMTDRAADGTPCIGLRGEVSTDNNGGFIQVALELGAAGATAGRFDGIRLQVAGNGERYKLHLRTADLWLPWQSYRADFVATGQWQEIRLPFADFEPYRTGKPLNPAKLRRIGVVAIGRDFTAEVCVRNPAFYRTRR